MFNRRGKPYAKAIELKKWQDPVEDVAAIFSESACIVYFFVSDSEQIGKLSFDGAWSFRSVRTEIAPYMDKESKFGSYILEVFNSPWPSEVEFRFYTASSKARLHNEAKHFLIKRHAIYHEVLCQSCSETYLTKEHADYDYAIRVLGGAS